MFHAIKKSRELKLQTGVFKSKETATHVWSRSAIIQNEYYSCEDIFFLFFLFSFSFLRGRGGVVGSEKAKIIKMSIA